MILGHHEIKRLINERKMIIDPIDDETIREAGIDLRMYEDVIIPSNSPLNAWTLEWIKLPNDVIGFCNLRSTFARMGLVIPPTIIDPSFEGHLVIEIFNGNDKPFVIRKGTRFLHVILAEVKGAIPYEGVYKGQRPPR